MNTVNRPFRKKDAMQLVTGQPVYISLTFSCLNNIFYAYIFKSCP